MPKVKTSRNPDYLRFVRAHSSIVTWDPPLEPWPDREDPLFDQDSFGTVAHHVRLGQGGGMGLKPSDYRTVPLTDSEHRELHQTGERSWWARRGVDPRRVIIALLSRYAGVENRPYADADLDVAINALEIGIEHERFPGDAD